MSERSTNEPKLERLKFETYQAMVRNSIGSAMFKNFYLKDADGKELDAMDNGDNSCAFYVSAVLTIMGKVKGIHGTINSTLEDMRESGWQEAETMASGDVLVWEAMEFPNGSFQHVGFYLGKDKAISASATQGVIAEHDVNFGEANRPVIQIFRHANWD
jgi:hypothetical protein